MSARNIATKSAVARIIGIILRCVLFLAAGTFGCALAEVSQVPLFLKANVKPNIMFTLDDSGSMACEFLLNKNFNFEPSCPKDAPTLDDRTEHNLDTAKFRSSTVNRIFYDPAIRYRPWQNADGTYQANRDPDQTIVDKAFYYTFSGGSNNKESLDSYTRVSITSGTETYNKSDGRTDCAGTSCTYAEEIQNFANWYKYYRSRQRTAIAGASRAFNELDGNYRVGYGEINSGSKTVDGVSTKTVMLGVRDFEGQARIDWFDKLFAAGASGSTPLRRALNDVGKYFSRSDNKGPWAEFPGVSKGTELSCRKNFHILMTDGYWTDEDGDKAYTSGTDDADNGEPAPFGSLAKKTLADVAYYFWKTDLRTLTNNVPKTVSDPADWQHVVQYTVGLGVDGTLDYPGDYSRLATAGPGNLPWPVPDANTQMDPKKTDDLWHAAVNGHGRFFNVNNAAEFVKALSDALADIRRTSAAAAIAVSSFRVDDGGKMYAPSFEPGTWVGHLYAYTLQSDGSWTSPEVWDAAEKLPAWDKRTIVTWNGTKGVSFTWPESVTADTITQDQKDALGSEEVLKYIRGDNTKEQSKSGGIYRDRATKLGDIVNSSPLFVKDSHRWYQIIPDKDAAKEYKAYFAAKASRNEMIYVGANDGMLHGFDAETGTEKLAFIPSAVYPNLKSLSDPNYTHKYFVDGYLTEGDAYISGGWKNVLMGSTGAGAKSVFAIDVTDPASMSASSIMWEKTDASEDASNQDLGYVMGQLELELMSDNSWAVIHGNGYDSGNKKAVLYIRNASDGSIIKKINTNVGGADAPNGLSAPVFVRDDQRRVIAAYAGDLQGNLWKFDLSDADKSKWAASILFTAKKSGKAQPVTTRPTASEHPDGGYIITFGTGKYYESADRNNTDVQSVYGIWDKPGATGVTYTPTPLDSEGRKTVLQEQVLTAATDGATLSANTVDWKTKRGWFIDLTLAPPGERVIADTRIVGDILLLTSFTPDGSNDPCVRGGVSRVYGVSYLTGRAVIRIFDTNGDGAINDDDAGLSAVNIRGSIADPRVIRFGLDGGKIIENSLDGNVVTLGLKILGTIYRSWNIPPEVY